MGAVMASGNDREIRRIRAQRAVAAVRGDDGRAVTLLAALLTDPAPGARLLVRRGPAADRCDAFLVTPGGVAALCVVDTVPGATAIRRRRGHAAQTLAGIPIGPHGTEFAQDTVELVLLMPPAAPGAHADGRFRVVTDRTLPTLTSGSGALTARQAARLADHLADRDPDYVPVRPARPERRRESGLLEVTDLRLEHSEDAAERDLTSWLTFLDPAQNALVARRYTGPARIAGPAGSGKTVLALHRMAHHARHSTGPLLFTTLVRTLPPAQQRAYRRLSPETAHRVEFTNLHAWARDFLAARGISCDMKLEAADAAMNLAWSRVRRDGGPLERICPDVRYWREEIDRVVKGRGLGLDDFATYAGLDRRGRRTALRTEGREHVWRLYDRYEHLLRRTHHRDGNDLITRALGEIRRRPLPRPYSMVVVDEVQDMTLQGLRLAAELTGHAPNALLLVGDRQQSIYAGGWTLSEAGIHVRGRSEVLTRNFRNRREIVRFAAGLPGAARIAESGAEERPLRVADCALPGGHVERWSGADAAAEETVVAEIAGLRARGYAAADIAILTLSTTDAERWFAVLRRHDIAAHDLAGGGSAAGVRIGTAYRAKGLDFRAVLHPFRPPRAPISEAESERAELILRGQFVAVTRARDHVWFGAIED